MSDNETPGIAQSPSANDANMTSLVAGIIADLQTLVVQQIRLTTQEVGKSLHRRRRVATVLTGGLISAVLSLVMLSCAAAFALHTATASVATETSAISLSVCFAIVGLTWLLLSGGLVLLGCQWLRAIPPWQSLADDLFQEKTPWTIDLK